MADLPNDHQHDDHQQQLNAGDEVAGAAAATTVTATTTNPTGDDDDLEPAIMQDSHTHILYQAMSWTEEDGDEAGHDGRAAATGRMMTFVLDGQQEVEAARESETDVDNICGAGSPARAAAPASTTTPPGMSRNHRFAASKESLEVNLRFKHPPPTPPPRADLPGPDNTNGHVRDPYRETRPSALVEHALSTAQRLRGFPDEGNRELRQLLNRAADTIALLQEQNTMMQATRATRAAQAAQATQAPHADKWATPPPRRRQFQQLPPGMSRSLDDIAAADIDDHNVTDATSHGSWDLMMSFAPSSELMAMRALLRDLAMAKAFRREDCGNCCACGKADSTRSCHTCGRFFCSAAPCSQTQRIDCFRGRAAARRIICRECLVLAAGVPSEAPRPLHRPTSDRSAAYEVHFTKTEANAEPLRIMFAVRPNPARRGQLVAVQTCTPPQGWEMSPPLFPDNSTPPDLRSTLQLMPGDLLVASQHRLILNERPEIDLAPGASLPLKFVRLQAARANTAVHAAMPWLLQQAVGARIGHPHGPSTLSGPGAHGPPLEIAHADAVREDLL